MFESLNTVGWNPFFEAYYTSLEHPTGRPARIGIQHRDRYVVYSEFGELWAELSGRFLFHAKSKEELPAVGDWVVIEPRPQEGSSTIIALLQRRTVFTRKGSGPRTEQQILAANIDIAFLVSGLDQDYNLRRIERYLTLAWESGAKPVVVLNKADLLEQRNPYIAALNAIAPGVDVLFTSANRGEGIAQVATMLRVGLTGVLLGSSGVGKSTLINALLGYEKQSVNTVRIRDSRGKHTTAVRELIPIPSGGMLIDTPGLREVQLWAGEESVAAAFEDIEALAALCRFRDCRHGQEPGCAVRNAVESGLLEGTRFQSYEKLQREVRYLALKQNASAAYVEKTRWKKIMKGAKEVQKRKGR